MTKHAFFCAWRDRLPLDRLLVIEEPITASVADRAIVRLLDLEATSRRDVCLFLASPGGDLKACLAIYETMRLMRCSVATIAIGDTASSAALLLAAGAAGRRSALSSVRITLHPPRDRGGRHHRERLRHLNGLVFRILSAHIGRPAQTIEADAGDERTFTAREAQAYGIVDWVDEIACGAALERPAATARRSV